MKIDDAQMAKLADAARIGLGPDAGALARDLEQIAAYASVITGDDSTRSPAQSSDAQNLSAPLRPDVVTNAPNAEALLAGAPDVKGTYIRVPRTVEE
ncbi:MAG: aspartyl/glutamyl-tRNA amidotransferase subunit C [Clostridiales bacterium]|nr:aspartyl/glutamyl-tRNA amidotransferase subunit C [Clostridiales bacterium]